MNTYRIVLADDHPLTRQGLRKILSEKEGFEIVGEAGDGFELLNLLERLALSRLTPHLVILDLSMPNLFGVTAASRIKMIHPDIKVLILTMHKDEEIVKHALSHGAKGYLLKDDPETELFSAIEMIERGESYISPILSGKSETDGKIG